MTRPILAHLDEFYEFFRDRNIPVKINPIFYSGRGATVRDRLGVTPVEYGEAMVYLFDRWFYEPEYKIDIDPFDLILGNLITNDPRGCQFAGACYDHFVSIDMNGDVYPCGRWSGRGHFRLGNLGQESLEEIRLSPVLDRFREGRNKAMEACAACEFHTVCNSGCVENSYVSHQRLSDRDIYCAGYRRLFGRIHQALIDDLSALADSIPIQEGPQLASIMGRQIDPRTITNPALRHVIARRVVDELSESSNYTKHEQWKDTYQDYREYREHKQYQVYSKYNEYEKVYQERWNDRHAQKYSDYTAYSDHSQNTTCP